MICNYCGAEIADTLKQCSECGMPTENLAVPVPVDIKTKKKKKKEIDLDKIPMNTKGLASLVLAGISIVFAILGGILALSTYGLSFTALVGFAAFVKVTTYISLALSFVLAIVGAIMALVAKKNKTCEQSTPLLGASFSLLGFIFSICILAIFILYVVVVGSAA